MLRKETFYIEITNPGVGIITITQCKIHKSSNSEKFPPEELKEGMDERKMSKPNKRYTKRLN